MRTRSGGDAKGMNLRKAGYVVNYLNQYTRLSEEFHWDHLSTIDSA